jgi:hypothetical protein
MNGEKSSNDQTFAGVFLIGLAILFITGWWWPGIMFVLGIAGIVRAVRDGRAWNDDRGPLVLLGIGVVFAVLDVFGSIRINFGGLWPVILIAIGLYLLFGKNLRGSTTQKSKNDDLF